MLDTPSWARSFCIVYVGLALVLVVSIVYTTWDVMKSSAKLSLMDMFNIFFPPAFAVLLLLLQFWVCRGALIEGFANAPSQYDNGKVYKVGDVVTKDGIIYIMNDGIGAAGYPPPRPTNWRPLPSANLCSPLPYDNGKVYKVGDVVTNGGIKYVMIDGIGAAGYPPPRPTNWTPLSADSNTALCPAAATASVCSAPNCVEWNQSRPGQGQPACGERVSVFGKPNFNEYNFSIPVGEWKSIDEIHSIPGNNKYTIYGGDGNVSMVFPGGCNLKLTINNGPNFSGPVTLVFTKTCAESLSSGACGQNNYAALTAGKPWGYAQSIRCERLAPPAPAPAPAPVAPPPAPAPPAPVAPPAPAPPAPAPVASAPLQLYVSQPSCTSLKGSWANSTCMF